LKRLVITFAICHLTFSNFGQTPSFNYQKLGSEEGLNNANIFNIEQNGKGLMYFTTQNGIYYYDGYNFNKIQISGLKSNALQGVSIKNDDELWLSIREEGLAIYEINTGKFQLQKDIPFKDNCDNFIVGGDFAYFLNSGTELNCVNLKTKTLIKDEVREKDRGNIAYCIFKSLGNKILIGRKDGLYELAGSKQVKLDVVKNAPIFSIAQSADGKLILGSSGSMLIVNNNVVEKEITPRYTGKSLTYLPGGERNIEKIITDSYGRIWFTSFPGENLYLYQNNTVFDVFETLDIPPSLINCLYKDRDQNIWVGTFNDGAYFIQNSHFNSFNFIFDRKVLNVNSVYLKNNLLAAGTSNGLFCMNLNTNESKIVSKPDPVLNEPIGNINEIGDVLYFSARNEIPSSAFADSKHIYKFKSISAAQFYPIDKERTVVADRLASVLLYNGNASKFIDTLISFSNYRISINDMLVSGDSLLVGTGSGLFLYKFSTKKYEQLTRSDLNFIINDLAYVNGELYAAHESGITSINGKKLIQKLGNLNLNSVKKIKQFNDQIWLATLDGVYICDKNWNPVKVLNKTSGLLSNSISDIVFNNETVCIATARGVAVANINYILSSDSRMKPVNIYNVRVNGDTIRFGNDQLNLNKEQDILSISFHSPQFSKPNKQLYRYRIDNGEWNNVNDNSIAVSITSGGKHSIDVSVSLDKINWSENATIQITKEAKITESNWTYILITLAGLLIISAISFFIVKRVKAAATRRLQEEQLVNQLKHQAMNSLLSPHFIFNSLTSIQNYINTNNALKASEYLAKFSRLIRMIIEKASQSEITLHDEIARLSYYLELEKERFKNKFDFNIEVDDKLSRTEIKIPNMIIQPHAENCIIHGILPKMTHGTLDIKFRKTADNKLLITIEDDGIGLIKAKEHAKTGHKSLGTATIRNILEINSKLNGKSQSVSMMDKSEMTPPSHGTLITIVLEL
jgi:ligand-binding sensor domain-containing protein